MDDDFARRHGYAVIRHRKAAADAENDVGILQKIMHRLRNRPATGAKRQRMGFRKGAFPLEACRHRSRQ